MVSINETEPISLSANVVDKDGVVPKWFIAIVRHNRERSTASLLSSRFGFQTFVASRKERKTISSGVSKGRKRTVDTILIPSRVFVRCTEEQRLFILKDTGIIERFMPDRTRGNGFVSCPAFVPDETMESFIRLIQFGDESFVFEEYPQCVAGDDVVVRNGALAGVHGRVIDVSGETCLFISIDELGGARVKIDPRCVEKVARS